MTTPASRSQLDLGWARRAMRAFFSEGLFIYERLLIKRQGRRLQDPGRLAGRPSRDWLVDLHQLLGIAMPCLACVRFAAEIWPAIEARTSSTTPTAGDRHDGDANLAQAVWSITIHLKPSQVVETGVARGMTSAAILAAMRENRSGHLYSIDLPALSAGWAEQTGAAVSPELSDRWTYIRGSTRRKLPGLIRRVGSIDLFVHDSLHTYDNMRFEFRLAWQALRPGGILIADDIQDSRAFDELVEPPASDAQVVPAWLVGNELAKPHAAWGIVVRPPRDNDLPASIYQPS